MSVFDIFVLLILLFLNYTVWIDTNLYKRYIDYYAKVSEASNYSKSLAWIELIESPYFIWFPRIVFLTALSVHIFS